MKMDDRIKFNKRERSRSRSRDDNSHRRNRNERDKDFDPYTADHCMSFKEFQDLNRSTKKDDTEIYKLFLEYKSDHEYRVCRLFFDAHKNDQWMNEKYHPIKCIPSREKHSLLKHLAFKEFSTLLNAKAFDGICYDESIPTTRTESSIDEEMKLAEDYQKPKQEPIATLSTQHCIFVRALPKEIGRDVLEGLCKGLEGVIGVYLLPPNATKGFIKFAFIVFETSEFLDKALSFLVQVEPINEFKIDFRRYQLEPFENRLISHEYKNPQRIKIDLTQIHLLIQTLDSESNIPSNSLIKTYLQNIDTQDPEKKELDLCILYCRFVHGFEYYFGHETLLPHFKSALQIRRYEAAMSKESNHIHRNGEDPALKLLKRTDLRIKTRIEKPSVGEGIKELGGKCIEESVEGYIQQIVKREGEGKFRCRECEKLFKGEEFCVKHVKTKHEDVVNVVKVDLEYFNAYVRDFDRVGEFGLGRSKPASFLREDRRKEGYGDNRKREEKRRRDDGHDRETNQSSRDGRRAYVDLDSVTKKSDPRVPVTYDY